MPKYKILLGLTTTLDSNWKEKIKECKKFNIEEVALFLTSVDFTQRKELYRLLENSPVKSIPHVHLRTDMELEELDYLAEKFHVQAFNIHPRKNLHSFTKDYSKYASMIYVENVDTAPELEEVEEFGGLCVDFSHWQDAILKNDQKHISEMETAIQKFKVGCSHISAIISTIEKIPDTKFPEIVYETYSRHFISNLKELDYVKNFIQYLPELISIELENSFAEQIEAKKYLEKIIYE